MWRKSAKLSGGDYCLLLGARLMHSDLSKPELLRDFTPKAYVVLVLSAGTVLTGAWIGFLGWVAVQVVSWAVR